MCVCINGTSSIVRGGVLHASRGATSRATAPAHDRWAAHPSHPAGRPRACAQVFDQRSMPPSAMAPVDEVDFEADISSAPPSSSTPVTAGANLSWLQRRVALRTTPLPRCMSRAAAAAGANTSAPSRFGGGKASVSASGATARRRAAPRGCHWCRRRRRRRRARGGGRAARRARPTPSAWRRCARRCSR